MTAAKSFEIPKTLVWEAYLRVKANDGAAGVDAESVEDFERDLKNNLYRLWNRVSSGTYFPPPVFQVAIPKSDGGQRMLGLPTVSDRIAQTVVKLYLEPVVESSFHDDSYGYRPGRPAHDAVARARERCWKFNWVLDLDVRASFDSLDHRLVLHAVRKYTNCRWVLLYLERWLKAPVQWEDGSLQERTSGTPQGGVVSPLLANIFLHFAFDLWMRETYPQVPFERYADDVVVHCRSQAQAEALRQAVVARLRRCRLEVHPQKTKIVYCKDSNRPGSYTHESYDFLGFTFRPRRSRNRDGRYFISFSPAVRGPFGLLIDTSRSPAMEWWLGGRSSGKWSLWEGHLESIRKSNRGSVTLVRDCSRWERGATAGDGTHGLWLGMEGTMCGDDERMNGSGAGHVRMSENGARIGSSLESRRLWYNPPLRDGGTVSWAIQGWRRANGGLRTSLLVGFFALVGLPLVARMASAAQGPNVFHAGLGYSKDIREVVGVAMPGGSVGATMGFIHRFHPTGRIGAGAEVGYHMLGSTEESSSFGHSKSTWSVIPVTGQIYFIPSPGGNGVVLTGGFGLYRTKEKYTYSDADGSASGEESYTTGDFGFNLGGGVMFGGFNGNRMRLGINGRLNIIMTDVLFSDGSMPLTTIMACMYF